MISTFLATFSISVAQHIINNALQQLNLLCHCIPNPLMILFCGLQEKFPSLASVPYPSWISVVIFLLAGIPSLAMPLYALCHLVFVCWKKKNQYPVKNITKCKFNANSVVTRCINQPCNMVSCYTGQLMNNGINNTILPISKNVYLLEYKQYSKYKLSNKHGLM